MEGLKWLSVHRICHITQRHGITVDGLWRWLPELGSISSLREEGGCDSSCLYCTCTTNVYLTWAPLPQLSFVTSRIVGRTRTAFAVAVPFPYIHNEGRDSLMS